jgi:nucleotide-binding universal stress UspA family protein
MNVRRILVGVDGSDNAQRALGWTIDLATALGAEVVAVHSLGLLESPHHDEIAEQFEQVWCAPLLDTDLPSFRVLRDGNPVQVIITVAEEQDVDLIVLGSRGVGGFPEQLLGSTSHQVAERTTRPVVIIPPQHRPAAS